MRIRPTSHLASLHPESADAHAATGPASHVSSGLKAPSWSTCSNCTSSSVLPLPAPAARSLLPDALERAGEEVLHVVDDGASQLILRRDHGDVLG